MAGWPPRATSNACRRRSPDASRTHDLGTTTATVSHAATTHPPPGHRPAVGPRTTVPIHSTAPCVTRRPFTASPPCLLPGHRLVCHGLPLPATSSGNTLAKADAVAHMCYLSVASWRGYMRFGASRRTHGLPAGRRHRRDCRWLNGDNASGSPAVTALDKVQQCESVCRADRRGNRAVEAARAARGDTTDGPGSHHHSGGSWSPPHARALESRDKQLLMASKRVVESPRWLTRRRWNPPNR